MWLDLTRTIKSRTWKLEAFFTLILLLLFSSITHAQYAPVGQFQLASPGIEASSSFFETSTTINLDLEMANVQLRYTLKGEAVTEESALYEGPISISYSATIKARAYHRDYQPSEEVQVSVFQITPGAALNASFDPNPAPQYAGQGALSLTDEQKGSMNFRDGFWLGFSADTIIFELNTEDELRQLYLSVMDDHGSWIFAPNQVQVWKGSDLVGNWDAESPGSFSPKSFQFIEVPLNAPASGPLQLQVIMEKIPEWHDGNGTTPWFFIDEIFITK